MRQEMIPLDSSRADCCYSSNILSKFVEEKNMIPIHRTNLPQIENTLNTQMVNRMVKLMVLRLRYFTFGYAFSTVQISKYD